MGVARLPAADEAPSTGDKARALFALAHPGPTAATTLAAVGLATVAEVLVSHGSGLWDRAGTVGAIAVIVGLSQVSISALNDICDLDLDRKTHPDRPLPSGLLVVGAAARVWVLTGAMTLGVGCLLAWPSPLLLAPALIAGYLYSYRLKRMALSWLPFAVAFPLLPVWELLALRAPSSRLWMLGLVGPPLAVAIHLADAIPDVEVDRGLGARGLATQLGVDASITACRLLIGVASVLCVALSWGTRLPVAALIAGGLTLALDLVIRGEWLRAGAGRYIMAGVSTVLCAGWLTALLG